MSDLRCTSELEIWLTALGIQFITGHDWYGAKQKRFVYSNATKIDAYVLDDGTYCVTSYLECSDKKPEIHDLHGAVAMFLEAERLQ